MDDKAIQEAFHRLTEIVEILKKNHPGWIISIVEANEFLSVFKIHFQYGTFKYKYTATLREIMQNPVQGHAWFIESVIKGAMER